MEEGKKNIRRIEGLKERLGVGAADRAASEQVNEQSVSARLAVS
jgi:hypothetical protein